MDRVNESLLAELTGGTPVSGTALPPAAELADRLGVRPVTIQAAIDALLQAGYLERGDGSSVHVRSESVYAGR